MMPDNKSRLEYNAAIIVFFGAIISFITIIAPIIYTITSSNPQPDATVIAQIVETSIALTDSADATKTAQLFTVTPTSTSTSIPTSTPDLIQTNNTLMTQNAIQKQTLDAQLTALIPTFTPTSMPSSTPTSTPSSTPTFIPTQTYTPTIDPTRIARDVEATLIAQVTLTSAVGERDSYVRIENPQIVNLRSGPGTNYRIVGSASTGDIFRVLARTSDRNWYLVAPTSGSNIWISASVVILLPGTDAINPPATIPPTPVPTLVPTTLPQPTSIANNPPRIVSAQVFGTCPTGLQASVDWIDDDGNIQFVEVAYGFNANGIDGESPKDYPIVSTGTSGNWSGSIRFRCDNPPGGSCNFRFRVGDSTGAYSNDYSRTTFVCP
jgi:hypothetical protein